MKYFNIIYPPSLTNNNCGSSEVLELCMESELYVYVMI